jgi:phosphoserine aminotransferase
MPSNRPFNFSAGPATLPAEVLEASAQALVDYQGSGVGIAEQSHRGKVFDAVRVETEALARKLLGLNDDWSVLFLQGGATMHFDLIPMNFLKTKAQYIDTGTWATKAIKGAQRHGAVEVIGSSKASNYAALPAYDAPDQSADYLHICSNNTIFGTRFAEMPKHPRLIADMSSEFLSRQIDLEDFAMLYGGAQKNLGPAGLVFAVIRKELLDRTNEGVAPIMTYKAQAEAESCLNTPPTFGIYMLLEVFRWLDRQGGVAAIETINDRKAKVLYDAIDGSGGYYTGAVTDPAVRSTMNVTFTLPNDDLNAPFLKGAEERGLLGLKGHRSVGGMRASIYNAMPEAGVQALVDYMAEFQKADG